MLRPLVLLALVPALLSAAEIPISETTYGPARRHAELRLLPAVAAGDEVDLVTWEERVMGAWPHTSTVMVRTFDRDGRPRQAAQIPIATGVTPRAVWNGEEFLLTYGIYISRFGAPIPVPAVAAVHVTIDGVVRGPRHTLLKSVGPSGFVTGLAWDGAHYLAGVSDGVSRLVLIDRDGRVVREIGMTASSIVAMPEGAFAVLRTENARADVVRVSASGDIGQVISVGALAPFGGGRLALHGDRFGVVWRSPEGIVAVEMDAGGHVLTSTMFPPDAIVSSIAWRDGAWRVAYARGTPATTACVKAFAPEREPSEVCRADARDPFVSEIATAWVTSAQPHPQVWVSRAAEVVAERLASETAAEQSQPVATESLVAWIEGDAVRVGSLFIPVEGATQLRGADARNATLLVVRDRQGRIRGIRIGSGGAPIGGVFDIGAGDAPSVAGDGEEWLVAWSHGEQIQTARVTASGDVFPAVPLFANASRQNEPSIAWTGRGYLVAWQETERAFGRNHRRILTQLADRGGNRIANAITPADDTTGIGAFSFPAIGCLGETCLVTWFDDSSLLGSIVTPSGATEPRRLSQALPSRTIVIAESDGRFRVFAGNRALRVSASGEPSSDVVWTLDAVTVGGIANGRLVYSRVTRPEEVLGGVPRVFTRELPPERVRMRAVDR